jgi:dipeptidyl aminopeptidase/acylaminoacyl peptidase
MRAIPCVSIVLASVAVISTSARSRPLNIDDLYKMQSVAGPTIDPSGRWVAYSVNAVDAKADKTFSHIWMAAWDGSRTVQLTNRKSESESTPRWSPDGRYLAFISSRGDKDDDDKLWLLDRTGGEARPIGKIVGPVVDYAWAPDGRSIAVIVLDPDPDKAGPTKALKPAKPGEPQPQVEDAADSDASADNGSSTKDEKDHPKPIVIDRFQFKRDIDGYLRSQRQRLYLLDVATGSTRRLTSGESDEYLPAFSPDGSRIAFVSNRDPDPDRTYNYDVWTVPAGASGVVPNRITDFPGADNDPDYESYPAWSPDGRSIAYLQGGPIELNAYGTRHLAVTPADGGPTRVVTPLLDRNIAQPRWSADGRTLNFIVEDDGRQWLGSAPASGGNVRRSLGGRVVLEELNANRAGKMVALVSDPEHPSEAYAIDGGKLRRLSHHNDKWLADVQLAPVAGTSFRSRDGTEVHGFLTRSSTASGRTPTLLRIHGGPQSQFDYSFSFEWQLFAANGYTVVAANPRGGTGRGQDYARAIFAAWGSVDVEDVLAAVDDAVARGLADPGRLGIGGWSYGGMLTNYTIASNSRFKAAASGASISNILAGYGTDQYIRDYEVELGRPWEKLDNWMKVSYPFFHSDRIVTPTLFLAGDKDFNVPLLNSEQMYQALKSRGVDTELVIYPDQFHGLKRPSFLKDRLQRYLDWYQRYLK